MNFCKRSWKFYYCQCAKKTEIDISPSTNYGAPLRAIVAIVMDKVDPEVCETETYNTQGVGSGDPRGSSPEPGEMHANGQGGVYKWKVNLNCLIEICHWLSYFHKIRG